MSSKKEPNNNLNQSLEEKLPICVRTVQFDPSTKQLTSFLDRVKTFIPQTLYSDVKISWTLKPNSLSPNACAKYGWICIGEEIIQCVTCKKVLSGKLPHSWESSVYEDCVKEIVSQLIKGHKQHCPWLVSPTPDNFLLMQMRNKSEVLIEFKENFTNLFMMPDNLLAIDELAVSKLTEFQEDLIPKICKLLTQEKSLESETSIFLSLTGWIRSTKDPTKYIHCPDCYRCIHLYFYNTLHEKVSQEKEMESSQENVKKTKTDQTSKRNFDPFYEHRSWCKWIMPSVKENSFGWELYRDCLLKNISRKSNSSNKEDLLKAYQSIQSWFYDK